MPSPNLTRSLRTLHLYFGVFISPAILFFALTGALQTVGLHEAIPGNPNYKPAHWIVVLAQIHKKQTPILPTRRPPAPENGAKAAPKPPAPPPPTPAAPTHNPIPLRAFFLIVSLGLFTSTATGLYMSYTYNRNKRLVTLALLAGILVPLLLVLL